VKGTVKASRKARAKAKADRAAKVPTTKGENVNDTSLAIRERLFQSNLKVKTKSS
jgi:hypothetical protein